MADETHDEMTVAPVFDDDRLLSFALGLDDDPQLVGAAAADDGLRRRLDAVRAEVEQMGARVRAAVPVPDEDHIDPRDPRWAGLQEFFATPAPARTRGRASRWLRVLVPIAVAVVAVAVGLAVISDRQSSTSSGSSSVPAEASKAGAGDDLAVRSSPPMSAGSTDQAVTFAGQVDQFALVVLARAKAVSGSFQRFAVVKVLKGDLGGVGPNVLRLRVADRTADAGRLQLLFLRPLPQASSEPSPLPTTSASAGTSPLDGLAAGEPVLYSYQGETAMARQLPTGTDPAAVRLP